MSRMSFFTRLGLSGIKDLAGLFITKPSNTIFLQEKYIPTVDVPAEGCYKITLGEAGAFLDDDPENKIYLKTTTFNKKGLQKPVIIIEQVSKDYYFGSIRQNFEANLDKS